MDSGGRVWHPGGVEDMKSLLMCVGMSLREVLLSNPQEPYLLWVRDRSQLQETEEDSILAKLHALGDPVVLGIGSKGFIGPTGDVFTAVNMVLSLKEKTDHRAWTTAYLTSLIPGVQIDYARWIFKGE